MGEVKIQEEDVMAVQNAVRLLRMIAERRAYTKDCDLGEPDRAASIRDASAYARHALERLEPALVRMTSALVEAQSNDKWDKEIARGLNEYHARHGRADKQAG